MLGSEFGNLLWGSIGGVGALSLVLRIQPCVCVCVCSVPLKSLGFSST